MLVATFGPTTAWEGREIIWDVDRFILVGHGAVPAAGVLDYDRLGQLVWASPELRAWVASVAQWEAGVQPASPGRPASYAGGAAAAGTAASGSRRLPTWAVVLIILGVCVVLLGGVLAVLIPSFVARTTETLASDAVVRAGVHTIRTGIEAYAVDHNGIYPAADEVNGVGLSRYIASWPTNPYTDLPMASGGGAGNFDYQWGAGGATYRIVGFGRDGATVIDLWGGGDSPQTY